MRNVFFIFFILYATSILSQDISISGYIKDVNNGEAIIDAVVYDSLTYANTVTNEYGYYNLSIPKGDIHLRASYVGFKEYSQYLSLQKDTVINIVLEESILAAVEVVGQKETSLSISKGNEISIPITELTQIPAIGGEADIFKSLSIFPGVSLGAEANSNLFVRGGTPDQNLILLDGVPVYNVSHIGGFLSVFNTDALKKVDLIKGGFPARYGGRLSSVVDIKMKEGNNKEFSGDFGLGLIASRLLLEGPIQKDKSSFMISGRTSYLGLINLFRNKEGQRNYFDYWLYDINAKVNFDLKKGNLFFSYYSGTDNGLTRFSSDSSDNEELSIIETSVKWGNTTASARYNYPINAKLFFKALVGYTQYKYNFSEFDSKTVFGTGTSLTTTSNLKNNTKLSNLLANFNLDYTPTNNHYIKIGTGFSRQNFSLPDSTETLLSNIGDEFYCYIEDNIKINKIINANAGLRFSLYHTNETSYQNIEPRLSLTANLFPFLTLSTSYSYMSQYIHLLSNGGFGFPNDIWIPSTENVPEEHAHQYTFGISSKINKHINISVEPFYKKMDNLIDYKTNQSDLLSNINDWENQIDIGGIGEVYGIESLVKINFEDLSGYLSYTLSKNERTFENINQGITYPFVYDRRHDFSVFLNYKLNEQWWFSSTWIFQTGRRVTIPVAVMPFPGGENPAHVFSGRNNGVLDNYHRLDLAINREKKTKRNNIFGWNLSIYNTYNNSNPSFLYVDEEPVFDEQGTFSHVEKEVKQVTLFSILPFVSIYLKF